ncbi:hypothetical protein ACVS9P_08920 [Caproicibacterium sp. NSD3]
MVFASKSENRSIEAKGHELQTIDSNEIVAQVRTMSFLKSDKAEMIKATDNNPKNDGVDDLDPEN